MKHAERTPKQLKTDLGDSMPHRADASRQDTLLLSGELCTSFWSLLGQYSRMPACQHEMARIPFAVPFGRELLTARLVMINASLSNIERSHVWKSIFLDSVFVPFLTWTLFVYCLFVKHDDLLYQIWGTRTYFCRAYKISVSHDTFNCRHRPLLYRTASPAKSPISRSTVHASDDDRMSKMHPQSPSGRMLRKFRDGQRGRWARRDGRGEDRWGI